MLLWVWDGVSWDLLSNKEVVSIVWAMPLKQHASRSWRRPWRRRAAVADEAVDRR